MIDDKPPASDGHHCDRCGRVLVTIEALARAVHSGCALTGEKHDLDACPSKRTFMLDAKGIRANLERQASD